MREVRVLSPIADPQFTVVLNYARIPDNSIRSHWVAPGLEGPVASYIANEYRFVPESPVYHPYIKVDPGGSCSSVSPVIMVDAGGFYVQLLLDTLHSVVDMLQSAPTKVYGGVECARFRSWPEYMIVLRPEHRTRLLEQLLPLVDESLGIDTARLQELSKSPHVQVAGFPRPEGEA